MRKIDFSKFDRKLLFKSKKTFVIAGVVILVLIIGVAKAVVHRKKSVVVTNDERVLEIPIKGTEEVISEDTLWKGSIEDSITEQKQKINQELDTLKNNMNQIQQQTPDSKQLQIMQENIILMTKQLDELRIESEKNKKATETEEKQKPISQYVIPLEKKEHRPIKTADNYIPAGSFAKAVLMSGVDVSTSLQASSDPDPILIRIVDHGTLPRKFASDLKDCHVIAYAYGDISSERAKIRLEKLSCTEVSTGEIIETAIAGFVSGPDGRQGVRGKVVSVDTALLGNAFIAGTLGGLANNFNASTAYRPADIILEKSNNTIDLKNRLRDSFSEGASSGLDRLSKYYIDKAESIQPIVQIPAGVKVDVIFTEGVFFGTTEVKKAISEKRDLQIQNEAKTSVVKSLDDMRK